MRRLRAMPPGSSERSRTVTSTPASRWTEVERPARPAPRMTTRWDTLGLRGTGARAPFRGDHGRVGADTPSSMHASHAPGHWNVDGGARNRLHVPHVHVLRSP